MNVLTESGMLTMEYYYAVKKNELLIHFTIWMNLEDMLSEKTDTKCNVFYDSVYMREISRIGISIVIKFA